MNEELEYNEPDYDEFGDEDQTPDYYECNCCGKVASKDPGGWGCPNCGAIMEPGYY